MTLIEGLPQKYVLINLVPVRSENVRIKGNAPERRIAIQNVIYQSPLLRVERCGAVYIAVSNSYRNGEAPHRVAWKPN